MPLNVIQNTLLDKTDSAKSCKISNANNTPKRKYVREYLLNLFINEKCKHKRKY